jgi:hypothetical protein
MPPPNLKPDFDKQANVFVDGLVDRNLRPLIAAGIRE